MQYKGPFRERDNDDFSITRLSSKGNFDHGKLNLAASSPNQTVGSNRVYGMTYDHGWGPICGVAKLNYHLDDQYENEAVYLTGGDYTGGGGS